MSCKIRNCDNEALYNEPKSTKPRYCKKHKKQGNVKIIVADTDSDSNSDNSSNTSDTNTSDTSSKSRVGLVIGDDIDDIILNKTINKSDSDSDTLESDQIKNKQGQKWGRADIDKLLKYVGENKTNKQIAKLLGRTERSIFCKKEMLAYDMSDEKTHEQISKIVGLTLSEVKSAIKKYDTKYSKKKKNTTTTLITPITPITSSDNKSNSNHSLKESIELVDKINELISKNIEHHKLTGKCAVSDAIINKLLEKCI